MIGRYTCQSKYQPVHPEPQWLKVRWAKLYVAFSSFIHTFTYLHIHLYTTAQGQSKFSLIR